MAVDTRVPSDWYRSSVSSGVDSLYSDREGVEPARLALEILQPDGFERILDLACATGGRVLELCRHGHDVIGIDSRQPLLECAGYYAEHEDLLPWFYEVDPREIEFEREFDIVLSIGGGAFEHYDYDEENLRAFAAAARALRPGGRRPSSAASTRSRNWPRSSSRSASASPTSSTSAVVPACRARSSRSSSSRRASEHGLRHRRPLSAAASRGGRASSPSPQ